MDDMPKHDPDAGFEPAFKAPPNACDAHFHVFGPAEKYSYGSDIRYKPPYEPVDDDTIDDDSTNPPGPPEPPPAGRCSHAVRGTAFADILRGTRASDSYSRSASVRV